MPARLLRFAEVFTRTVPVRCWAIPEVALLAIHPQVDQRALCPDYRGLIRKLGRVRLSVMGNNQGKSNRLHYGVDSTQISWEGKVNEVYEHPQNEKSQATD